MSTFDSVILSDSEKHNSCRRFCELAFEPKENLIFSFRNRNPRHFQEDINNVRHAKLSFSVAN